MVHEFVQKFTERQGSEVNYRQIQEPNVDHLKFRIDLVVVLVKFSILRGVSGHHDCNNTVDRLKKTTLSKKNNCHGKQMHTNKALCCLQHA